MTKQIYSSGTGNKDFYTDKFKYEKETNVYICPAGKNLKYFKKRTKKDKGIIGYEYRNYDACRECEYKERCTKSEKGRTLCRHVDQDFLDTIDLQTELRRNKFMLGTTNMQNGEKEINKRIKYIACFKKPKVYWSLIILAVGLIIGGICLTNKISDKEVPNPQNQAQALLQYKTPYVGDHVTVGNILGKLKLPSGVSGNGMELKTENKPYGIIINYNVSDNSEILKDGELETLQFYKNSAVLFSLVDNVDNIFINLKNSGFAYQIEYKRQEINAHFKTDVRDFSKDEEAFEKFLTDVENIKLDKKSSLHVNGPTVFNIYKADEQLIYLYKAGSYFVEKESMTQELPDIIKKEYGIDIKKMYFEGTTMVLDLTKNMESELDKGSAYAAYKLSVLYKSLLERDNIKAVKVLIDGKEGVEGNHYSFRTPAALENDGRTAVEKYFQIAP